MSAIFGGSKSKQQSQSTQQSSSQSYNRAYDTLASSYSPAIGIGNQAMSQIGALLGLGGDVAGAQRGFDTWKGSTGYQRTLDVGNRAVTTNSAARGLLGSGATLRALNKVGQETNQQYFGNYLTQLLGLSGQGMQAGGLLAGAGNVGNSTSTGNSTSSGSSSSTNGLAGFLGQLGTAAAISDIRVKKDIVKHGELPDGLGLYEWTYKFGGPRVRGVMAQEVQKLRPWALGPTVNGYMTVDYSRLEKEAA